MPQAQLQFNTFEQADDTITARDDVAAPDYKYRASEFNRLTDKLSAPRVGE